MKKCTTLIVIILLLGFTQPCFALPNSLEKLGDGAMDIVTAPAELFKGIDYYSDVVKWQPAGLVTGIFGGTGQIIQQTFDGFVKILTFPISH